MVHGVAPHNGYPITVIFPISDEMITVSSSPPARPGPPEWAVRGVKTRLGAPYYPSLDYTRTYEAELVVNVLKEKKGATIGIVRMSSFHVAFYQYVTQHLPSVTFVDMTDPLDHLKAIKSAEEIALIRGTAALQDMTMEHLKKTIKPGMRDLDINAEADYISTKLGSTRLQVLIGSYHPGEEPVRFQTRNYMNRVLREGDQIVVLLEGNGPGGYYTEISRVFSLWETGTGNPGYVAQVLEAQRLTLSMLKPGANPKDIWDANNEFLRKIGSTRREKCMPTVRAMIWSNGQLSVTMKP